MSNLRDTSGVIIKGVGGAYSVSTTEGVFTCTARGIFRNRQVSPTVGDKVLITITDEVETEGTLHTILPRANELPRPKVANIDQAIITMAAAQPEFNAGLLDRFLILSEFYKVPAVICVNKCDLVTRENINGLTEPYFMAGYGVVCVSARDAAGTERLREIMTGKISVFAGPSGVGKSSLINHMTLNGGREVGALSVKIERGKHTTRHTELLPIEPEGFCADTPGFTSLDLSMIEPEKIAELFIEFKPFLNKCRFSDCRHESENDCAVKNAVGEKIHPLRYARYVDLRKKLRG